MNFRFTLIALFSILPFAVLSAQNGNDLSENLERRYELVVSKLGYAGVGVETILNQWEKVDSLNPKLLIGRFNYYYTKAATSNVVVKKDKRYLGMDPVLTLKDSTGADVYYFQETVFDDALFSSAMKYADKAIDAWPDRLDFRYLKASSLIAYEKDSPDMALSYLLGLIDKFTSEDRAWTYPGAEVDDTFFVQSMQEFCYSFFRTGSPVSYEAFRVLSERMLADYPDETIFLSNLGSYCFVVKNDYDKALKLYKKVLKSKPDDYGVVRNCVLLARKKRDIRLEKKYLPALIELAPENEKAAAKARLEALTGKRS